MTALGQFAFSCLLVVLAGLMLVHWSPRLGIIDLPDPRKVHVQPTPRTGGLAMVLGCAGALFLGWELKWQPWPHLPWATWAAGAGFILLGALDDRYSLLPRHKILFQFGFALLAAWPWVGVLARSGALGLSPTGVWLPRLLPLAYLLFSFWYVAVPNAVNIEDAINGYMGGYTLLILLVLGKGLGGHGLILGALAGFLLLNWPRARHFMGDAGSFGCGFVLAEAILRSGAISRPSMFFALTAPISMDVAMGLIRRRRLAMGFFVPDRRTCPHHTLALFRGRVLPATLLLWLNALCFALLPETWVLPYALLYLGILLKFNWPFLQNPHSHGTRDRLEPSLPQGATRSEPGHP